MSGLILSLGAHFALLLCAGTPAQERAASPWLRTHFSIMIRGPEVLQDIRRLDSESRAVSPAVESLFAAAAVSLLADLPPETTARRTYLRCMPLGWQYGGHRIDTIRSDPATFEAALLSRGVTLGSSGHSGLLQANRNQFVIADYGRKKVSSLYVPGGFSGTRTQIFNKLQTELESAPARLDDCDWQISIKPSQLLTREMWTALRIGIETAAQARNGTDPSLAVLRETIGKAAIGAINAVATDIDSCTLSMLESVPGSGRTVTLAICAMPDTSLREFLNSLSRKRVKRSFRSRRIDRLPLRGICVAELLAPLSQLRHSTAFGDEAADDIVFGIASSVGDTPEIFMSPWPSSIQGVNEDAVAQRAMAISLGPDRPMRWLNTEVSASASNEAELLLSEMMEQTEFAPDVRSLQSESQCWLKAECDVHAWQQLAHFSGNKGRARQATEYTIKICACSTRDGCRIVFEFPEGADRDAFLVFETAFTLLRQVSLDLPFDE